MEAEIGIQEVDLFNHLEELMNDAPPAPPPAPCCSDQDSAMMVISQTLEDVLSHCEGREEAEVLYCNISHIHTVIVPAY